MKKVSVGLVSDFADSTRKILEVDEIELAVFQLDGDFFAYLNECPHMGGPACQGKIIAKVEEVLGPDKTSKGLTHSKSKLNITCPWHGYEFDIRTGLHHGNSRFRLKKLQVRVEDGHVVVAIPNNLPLNAVPPRDTSPPSHEAQDSHE